MSWLLIQIWSALAIIALLGLVFGWALRGIGLKTRLRRLKAERDLVATDRDQLREELDTLYASRQAASQASRTATSGSDDLSEEIAKRDDRLKALGDELNTSKKELERLREEASRARAEAEAASRARAESAAKADAAVKAAQRDVDAGVSTAAAVGGALAAGAAAGATVSRPAQSAADADERVVTLGKQRDELTWRNRYLESRVRMLEETVSRIEKSADAAVADAQPELAAKVETLAAENGKLRGEVESLRERASDPDPAGRPAHDAEIEQELARLRWRNRYLESRLDYLEGNPDTAAEEARAEADREAAAAAQRANASAQATGEGNGAADVPAAPEPVAPGPEPRMASAVAASGGAIATVDPSDDGPVNLGALGAGDGRSLSAPEENPPRAEAEPVEPKRLEAPRSEGPDRLSDIEGIGPMIERALNQLGVFHIDQVASWNDGEAMWIDRALGFNNGRVLNDDWAGKARTLISQRAN